MNKLKSSKSVLVITIASIVMLLLLITGVVVSYSKNASLFGLFSKGSGSDNTNNRVAYFDVSVDGNSDTTVDFKAYATTKVSDIEKIGDSYKANSFKEGAYQMHTITVKNNSEVAVKCNMSVTKELNDNRVFYVIVPNVENNVLGALYTDSTLNSIDDVRAYVDSLNKDYDKVDIGETKTYSMIIWSEHDAVFTDEDNDGIADEEGKMLTELVKGVPSERFAINYSFDQYD